jgi:large subunit ribosomal protein L32e
MKRKRPTFLHQEHWKLKRFKKASWRKPRGKRSKMRSKERAKPYLVSIGYRSPKKVRNFHPKGVPEIIVHNVEDVQKIKTKGEPEGNYEYVIRIASSVGTRKKIDIVRAAAQKPVHIANPALSHVIVASVEELESFETIKDFIKTWFISDKVPEDEKEKIEERAEELGIEVIP